MVVIGTIALFRHHIAFPSTVLAFARGLFGAMFLLVVFLIRREKVDTAKLKRNVLKIIGCGFMLGINWVLIFEGFRLSEVSVTELCNNMGPVIFVVIAAVFFHERLSFQKIVCVSLAAVGVVFVSGILWGGGAHHNRMLGVVLGLCGAVLYAATVTVTRRIEQTNIYLMTAIMLFAGAIVTLPYMLIAGEAKNLTFDAKSVILTLIVSFVHTGMCYAIYYSALPYIHTETIALYAYIDPIETLLIAGLFLGETMSAGKLIGAVLILGSTLFCELMDARKKANQEETTTG